MSKHALVPVVAFLALSAQPAAGQQASEFDSALGLVLGTTGIGLEVEFPMLSRLGVTAHVNAGYESSVLLGPRITIAEQPGLRMYADMLVGAQQCAAVGLGGLETGCSYEVRWRPVVDASLGVEARLGFDVPLTFALEGGAWIVEEPGTHYVLSMHFRYWFDD